MKKIMAFVMSICWVVGGGMVSAEKAPQEVVDLARTTLGKRGTHPIVVSAVNAENVKNKTLESIKVMDHKWKKTPGIVDYMRSMMDSACGQHLRSLQNAVPCYVEIFVMDNQGANVCMTDKTSDYWQGDEDKFIESYKGGAGALHISDIEFDDSTQAYLVQVSVPVKDEDQVIGVMTFGIDIDQLEQTPRRCDVPASSQSEQRR